MSFTNMASRSADGTRHTNARGCSEHESTIPNHLLWHNHLPSSTCNPAGTRYWAPAIQHLCKRMVRIDTSLRAYVEEGVYVLLKLRGERNTPTNSGVEMYKL